MENQERKPNSMLRIEHRRTPIRSGSADCLAVASGVPLVVIVIR
jgi:hypothetical protein